MKHYLITILGQTRLLGRDQRGASGLETAIILVAFVALAAVFGFAVLKTGILAARKTTETGQAALTETGSALHVRGPVIGLTSVINTPLERVQFQVTVVGGREGIFLTNEGAIMTYIDKDQIARFNSSEWSVTWLIGFGSLLNPGERVEISLDVTGLDPPLGPGRKFSIEFSPDQGLPLKITRRTPAEFDQKIMDLFP